MRARKGVRDGNPMTKRPVNAGRFVGRKKESSPLRHAASRLCRGLVGHPR
ncbi:hypothetical protein KCP75_05175 [Salmonella enterica subsp. enterica]|nr:hypothetical protein KCP75_05175 [Salmonella enterica subsp. enterica]